MLFCLPTDLSCSPPALLTMTQGRYQCPTTLSELTPLLVRDLPSYANRAAQRQRKIKDLSYSHYILAGRPDLTPITIENPEYTPIFPQAAPQQLFLSTLEKRYQGLATVDLQRFHWLFLTYRQSQGWYLALIYSHANNNAQEALRIPPMDSLRAPVGEAVNNWLRDCRAGRIKP